MEESAPGTVRLDLDGPIATITNDNPSKRNAFTDAMDQRLFEILGELRETPGLRAVIWRGEGHSFSSGRDVGAIGGGQVELTHHQLMARGHRGIQQILDRLDPQGLQPTSRFGADRWGGFDIAVPLQIELECSGR